MIHHKTWFLIISRYSMSTSSINWRSKTQQWQLVSQITSILLQRTNWTQLLNNLNLSSKLTSPHFHQILQKTQSNPLVCLHFFNWARTHLGFNPDLECQCRIIKIAIGSGLEKDSVKSISDSLIRDHHVSLVLDTMVQVCNGSKFDDELGFLIRSYLHEGLFMNSLEVYKKMRFLGCFPSVDVFNSLLEFLLQNCEVKLALSFYGAMVRDGIMPDKSTWSILAQILSKTGKFQTIMRLLNTGIHNSTMYNLVIDFHGKNGDFPSAMDLLKEMTTNKKLHPGFGTYSSVLDGACKFRNNEAIEIINNQMMKMKLLPCNPLTEIDVVIQKLCSMGKTYAADMFFNKARDEQVKLGSLTYNNMLYALSEEGRVGDAIEMYRSITEMGLEIEKKTYDAFANALCSTTGSSTWNKLKEACELLRGIIVKGYTPRPTDLSRLLIFLCKQGRWKEAEELLNTILDKGLFPDSLSCSWLIKKYCHRNQIREAVDLHNKTAKLQRSLDLLTYNTLLDGLFREGWIGDAIRVFDYMRSMKIVSSVSYTIMIRGLCRAKEMRKAMQIHDEMLELGLKPDKQTYKHLIVQFSHRN